MTADVPLLYQDAQILAFDKPSGLAVQGGSGVTESLETHLARFAKSNGKVPRLVHRLDRETSGVIVAARTKPAAAALSEAFATRAVEKLYLAIACGPALDPPEGVIDAALQKSSRNGLDIMIPAAKDGLAARTRYSILASTNSASLIALEPESGRMHQLRAHLALCGRPIAGDGKYGGLFAIGAAAMPRLMLHALRLKLPHPAGGTLTLFAPPPDAFVTAARALGLDRALEEALALMKAGTAEASP